MHLVLEKIIVPCKVFTKKYISNRSEICVSPSKIYIKRLMQKYSPVCFWISDPEAAAASKTAPIFISRTTTSLGDIWREKFFSVKTAARKIFFRQNTTTKNGEDEVRRFCFNDTHDVDQNKFENLAADFNLFGNFYWCSKARFLRMCTRNQITRR